MGSNSLELSVYWEKIKTKGLCYGWKRSISSSSKGITVMYIALRRSCSGLYCMKIGIEEEEGVTEESEKKKLKLHLLRNDKKTHEQTHTP